MTGLLGEGRDRAEAGVAAVTDGSETSSDFHSWFLGQTKLLSVQPLMQGLLVLCSPHMLKPSGFKASIGSTLTPCMSAEGKAQDDLPTPGGRALKASARSC